jgi:hypothetical protein
MSLKLDVELGVSRINDYLSMHKIVLFPNCVPSESL